MKSLHRSASREHTAGLRLDYRFLLLLIGALLLHGLLLFNDGFYFDGALIYSDLVFGKSERIYQMVREAGAPQIFLIHQILLLFGSPLVTYKFAAFVALLLSSVSIYGAARDSGLLSHSESFWIALLHLAYPAYRIAYEQTTMPYLAYYCCFLLAVWLAVRGETQADRTQIAWRSGALILFFISFTVASLLMFYGAFLILLWFMAPLEKSFRTRADWVRAVLRFFAVQRPYYLVLPPLFWILKKLLFPVQGLYAGYNEFQFSPTGIVTNAIGFLRYGLWDQLNQALRILMQWPALVVMLALAALAIYKMWRMESKKFSDTNNARPLFWFAVLLWILGTLPYILVGKSPSDSFDSRHALLVALPVSLLIVALVRALALDDQNRLSRSGFVSLCLLLSGFGAVLATNYARWEIEWIRTRSMLTQLKTLPPPRANVLWVEDRRHPPLRSYFFYEWSTFFKIAWGDESRLGMDVRSFTPSDLVVRPEYFAARYNLAQFNPRGPQTRLIITDGALKNYSGKHLLAKYYFYKFLHPAQLDDFLRQLCQVRLQPMVKK